MEKEYSEIPIEQDYNSLETDRDYDSWKEEQILAEAYKFYKDNLIDILSHIKQEVRDNYEIYNFSSFTRDQVCEKLQEAITIIQND